MSHPGTRDSITSHWEVRRVRRAGKDEIGGDIAFITTVPTVEAVGLAEIAGGIWCLGYRRRALFFLDLRSGSPRVMAEQEADDLLKNAEE